VSDVIKGNRASGENNRVRRTCRGKQNLETWRCRSAGFGFFLGLFLAIISLRADSAAPDPLASGFTDPPPEARTRAYWWWLNGNVTRASITRDLEEMKAKGWGGALLCDAGGAEQDNNDRVPHGPTFFTPEWRELYKHTLREADRLGLEISLNIQSGWNLGGPMVTADDSAKKLVWTNLLVNGPTNLSVTLPQPKVRDRYYREIAVLAYPIRENLPANRPPIRNWEEKAIYKDLHFSAPDTRLLLEDFPGTPGEEDTRTRDIIDLSSKVDANGVLTWVAPPGRWEVLRFGYTIGDRSFVSTSSDGWKGYALDVLDEGALKRYWTAVVEPLIDDAGPLAGKTLRYLHTDSWEVEPLNWTPKYRQKFQHYRGYDSLPWMPTLAGRIVNSREETGRFLDDFRRTLGDLAVDEHYLPYRKWAHKRGLEIHPESGGPHAVPIDAQRCLGLNDIPMSEFWAWSWRHRVGDTNRFFVKQPASAAHTYGRKLVAAEGFTTIGPHWQETIWDNLKPSFDHACMEGLNRLVWHAFVCSPAEAGMPGQQYFAGTHMNPNVTWWDKSGPFIQYLNRCQFMLQQGLFVADAVYYYGNHVPNFSQLRSSDPARLGDGYDYDVITEDAIINRAKVSNGRLVLPDGMSYRALVLPDRNFISLPVLRKLSELVGDGATVIGTRPDRASGLEKYPASDSEVQKQAGRLWMAVSNRKGVVTDKTVREWLEEAGVKPDFESAGGSPESEINYIHRVAGNTDIYFVASRSKRPESVRLTFRIAGKAPELWDPVSGDRRFARTYQEENDRTSLPVELPPCGSMFVVFREPAAAHPSSGKSNHPQFTTLSELGGPWTVSFDPNWGGPANAQFDQLVSWTERPEARIKYYSGTGVYQTDFTVPAGPEGHRVWLDLGNVRELAEVKVNGQSCGITWAPPFRVEITRAIQSGVNKLEVEVVNFWPNRIIGDQSLAPDQRLTRTNIRRLTSRSELMPSGLLGPVQLIGAEGISLGSN
jgi:hypothetical protein